MLQLRGQLDNLECAGCKRLGRLASNCARFGKCGAGVAGLCGVRPSVARLIVTWAAILLGVCDTGCEAVAIRESDSRE